MKSVAIAAFLLVAAAIVGIVYLDTDEQGSQTPDAYSPTGHTPPTATGVVITIGSVSEDAKEETMKYRPLADYLAASLQLEPAASAHVRVTRSLPKMVESFKAGEVDLYIDSPISVAYVCTMSGAVPVLRRWKKGVSEYHAVIFVRKGSGITRVEDLVGKRVAFSEPYSTSAYLLPKSSLLAKGLKFHPVGKSGDADRDGVVNYIFSDDDETSLLWVQRGLVDAAALSDKDFKELAAGQVGQFRIIHETVSVPRHVVCFRGDLDPERRARLISALKGMHASPRGRLVLSGFSKTKMFDEFPGGLETYFQPIQKMASTVFADLAR